MKSGAAVAGRRGCLLVLFPTDRGSFVRFPTRARSCLNSPFPEKLPLKIKTLTLAALGGTVLADRSSHRKVLPNA
jgi:hypothetical protein